MTIVLPGIIASICYLAAAVLQAHSIVSGSSLTRSVKILAIVAVILHGATNIQDLVGAGGIDLGIYPMLSLMALVVVFIVLITSFRSPLDNLFIVIFPIATITLLLEVFLHGDSTTAQHLPAGIVGHILLSIAAYSLLTVAAVQAVLLSLGDNFLRNHRLVLLQSMPPLETMEQLMFEMVAWGLVFLTLSITSGFIFLEDISGPGLWHHTVITLLAWIVFMVLLWGRIQLGWRGAIASRWALTGFVLLALGYFGSKAVIELILA